MMENTEPIKYNCQNFYIPRHFWPEVPLKPSLLYIERLRRERTGPHSVHDFWEVIGIVGGTGVVQLPDGPLAVSGDEVIFMPPGVTHSESGGHHFDTVWIGFTLEDPRALPSRPFMVRRHELTGLMLNAWEGVRRAQRFCGPELDGQLLTILGILLRLFRTNAGQNTDDRWEDIFAYIRDNLSSPLGISELAAYVGCSESYFFRRFRELAGCTPLQYLSRLRLNQVKVYLLNSELTLSQIAGLCGFSDPYYLSKNFHRYFGMAPDAFRKSGRRRAPFDPS